MKQKFKDILAAIAYFLYEKGILHNRLPELTAPRQEWPAAFGNSKAVFSFAEPMVQVPGNFVGQFSFGSFPAGQAAALQD